VIVMSTWSTPTRSAGRPLRSAAAVAIACLLAAPATAQSPDGSVDIAEACEPAHVPFDAENVRLTGDWAGDDGGVYYIRQVGDQVWWTGMSGREGPSDELGRDYANVGHGTLDGEIIRLDFADVPRGNVWGQGNLTVRVEASDEGDLQLRVIAGDFSASALTPCAAEPALVDTLAVPYSYAVPLGAATATWPGDASLATVITADVPNAGLSTWVVGPGWTRTCSWQGEFAPLAPGPDGLIDYLRGHPDLEVSEPVSIRLDGHRGVSVDVTADPDASGCDGDGYVRIWNESGRETGVRAGGTTRISAVDVDGRTVAFEVFAPVLEPWAPQAQAIIESVRFDTDSAIGEPIGETADDGAKVVRVEALDERTRDLTIESPSVGFARVRLLLPEGFDESGDEEWPVLYLLHGAWDDYTSWTRETDVAELDELRDILVVMPDAGTLGWYSDWWYDGAGGVPAWETFHTDELVQLLERGWQAGPDRVIAGLSMGGFGTMSYASRHPGMFKAAASYSGVMDTVGADTETDPAVWGDKTAQADIWEAHNPLSQADKLQGTPLYVSWGNGEPGPLDAPGDSDDGLEAWVAPQNEAFAARLDELGIDAEIDDYGDGLHTWPYWERALHDSLPMLREGLGLGRR
jgi:S-formylglutathione hydrolase FrmB